MQKLAITLSFPSWSPGTRKVVLAGTTGTVFGSEHDDKEVYIMADSQTYVSAPLVTVAEAAKYLGVSRSTIYQLIEWGEIRPVKVKGSILIELQSLETWRAEGKLS